MIFINKIGNPTEMIIILSFISVSNAFLPPWGIGDLDWKETLDSSNGNNFSPLLENEDAYLTVPEVIKKYGYPSEIHKVVTEDGYILEAHRIPYGKKCGKDEPKRVVWLQHGLTCDSSVWILSGAEMRGIAYELADNCYDVWMGNFRGNTYSRNHLTLPPNGTPEDRAAFWNFSYHEMGVYDVPANIDYALSQTGAGALYYIGHSMGTTTFFICMSERPEYNSKIVVMSALAPVAYIETGPEPNFYKELIIRLGIVEEDNFFGGDLILPSGPLFNWFGETICALGSPTQAICAFILGVIGGFNDAQLDLKFLPILLGHVPAGTSSRVVVHYSQGGGFRQFDYGLERNLIKYGQEMPPEYDVSKITAPVALYWSLNDNLVPILSVEKLANAISNLTRNYQVEDVMFNHMDFTWALDQHTLINKPVIDFMNEFTPPPVTGTTVAYGSSTEGNGSSTLFKGSLSFILLILVIVLYC